MGYSQLTNKRRVQSEHVYAIKRTHNESVSRCSIPAYGALFVLVASLCTGLLGSIFFVYKWFACLNFLIGKHLFKPLALTIVWTILFVTGIGSIWFGSFWLLIFVCLGHVAVVIYLLSQLRKCRACSEQVVGQQKKIFWGIVSLWIVEILLIFCCGMPIILLCASVLVLTETCMIQRMFNLAVCEALENQDFLSTKMANDWQGFRSVMVWFVICLSVLLFFWDIGDTVLRILNIKYLTYHDFSLDGKFHLWLFFEEYSPHAWWQLCLWGVALLICKMPLNLIQNGSAKLSGKASPKELLSALFPNVTNK